MSASDVSPCYNEMDKFKPTVVVKPSRGDHGRTFEPVVEVNGRMPLHEALQPCLEKIAEELGARTFTTFHLKNNGKTFATEAREFQGQQINIVWEIHNEQWQHGDNWTRLKLYSEHQNNWMRLKLDLDNRAIVIPTAATFAERHSDSFDQLDLALKSHDDGTASPPSVDFGARVLDSPFHSLVSDSSLSTGEDEAGGRVGIQPGRPEEMHLNSPYHSLRSDSSMPLASSSHLGDDDRPGDEQDAAGDGRQTLVPRGTSTLGGGDQTADDEGRPREDVQWLNESMRNELDRTELPLFDKTNAKMKTPELMKTGQYIIRSYFADGQLKADLLVASETTNSDSRRSSKRAFKKYHIHVLESDIRYRKPLHFYIFPGKYTSTSIKQLLDYYSHYPLDEFDVKLTRPFRVHYKHAMIPV